jgi:hypothetical protein
LQLLAVIGLAALHRGQTMICFWSFCRTIFGARSPAAA